MKTAAASANATLNHLASRSGVTPLVKRHPYGLAGMAFGLGYVVSGGFLTPSTGRILGMAVSLTAIPAVRERLIQLIDSALAPTT